MKRITEHEHTDEYETENPRVKTAIYLSCVAGVCTVIVMILVSEHFRRGISLWYYLTTRFYYEQ